MLAKPANDIGTIMKSNLLKACAVAVMTGSFAYVHANETPQLDLELVKPSYSIVSRDIIVGDGDTLGTIADRELGSIRFAQLLASYNGITLSSVLNIGDIVRIPQHVPPRGEYAEVVFTKGTLTAERAINAETLLAEASVDQPPSDQKYTYSDAVNSVEQTEIIELKRNSRVFEGDLLTTSPRGFASIAFSSGSVVNLQPDTAASIERLVCLETDDSCIINIDTLRGRVTSNIESRDQQPTEFTIVTPFASAAVRGTIFDLDADEKLKISVTEGAVDVEAQNNMVPVNSGFGVVVQQGSAPGEPIELIPPPVFKRVPARMVSGDTVEWFAFADAERYEAVLSLDESANQLVTDIDIPTGEESFDLQASLAQGANPSPYVGDYFFSVRAIDAQGLLGLTSTTRLTLAEIDTDVQPVNTSIARVGTEFLVTVENPAEDASGYEIQISPDDTFADPLTADVNATGAAVFRIEQQDQVFARARVLIDPFTVSAFGNVSSN